MVVRRAWYTGTTGPTLTLSVLQGIQRILFKVLNHPILIMNVFTPKLKPIGQITTKSLLVIYHISSKTLNHPTYSNKPLHFFQLSSI